MTIKSHNSCKCKKDASLKEELSAKIRCNRLRRSASVNDLHAILKIKQIVCCWTISF